MSAPGSFQIICPLVASRAPRRFLALQRGIGGFRKLVVLREVARERFQGEADSRRLLIDVEAAAALSHPHIVNTFELTIVRQKLHVVTELASGATLEEVLEAAKDAGQSLPVGFILRVIRDAALALQSAHAFVDTLGRARCVVHGALSGRTLLTTFDGVSKVLDFDGAVEPLLDFESPEQIRGEGLDARSDIFSLAAVLYSALTRRSMPFAKVLMRAPTRAEFPPASELNAEVGPQLDQVLTRALFPAKESRYATALDFARDLERLEGMPLFRNEQSAALVQRWFFARREQLRSMALSEFDRPTTEIMPLWTLVDDPLGEEPGTSVERRIPTAKILPEDLPVPSMGPGPHLPGVARRDHEDTKRLMLSQEAMRSLEDDVPPTSARSFVGPGAQLTAVFDDEQPSRLPLVAKALGAGVLLALAVVVTMWLVRPPAKLSEVTGSAPGRMRAAKDPVVAEDAGAADPAPVAVVAPPPPPPVEEVDAGEPPPVVERPVPHAVTAAREPVTRKAPVKKTPAKRTVAAKKKKKKQGRARPQRSP